MNMPRVQWGSDGFASVSGWALCHSVIQATGEFFRSEDSWIVYGTGLPAGAYLDEPPPYKEGMAIVRQDGAWAYVEDHRGKTVFNKTTRQAVVIDALGSISSSLTLLPPQSQFDVWDDVACSWVKDVIAEQAWFTQQAQYQRSSLLGEASIEIAALLDALDPEVISNPDDAVQTKLLEWKRYRADLAVIDCSVHPVQWPTKPV